MKSNGWIKSKRQGISLGGNFAQTIRAYSFLGRNFLRRNAKKKLGRKYVFLGRNFLPKNAKKKLFSQKGIRPARQCKPFTQTNTRSLASDSAIGLRLLENPVCAQHYNHSRFSLFDQGRSAFHLSTLEATFIKTSISALRWQKNSCTA